MSRDGGVASPPTEGRGGSDVVEGGRTALDNKTSLLNTQPPRAFPGPRVRDYTPYPYSDTINTYDKTALKEAVFDDDMEQLRDGLSFLCLIVPHPRSAFRGLSLLSDHLWVYWSSINGNVRPVLVSC